MIFVFLLGLLLLGCQSKDEQAGNIDLPMGTPSAENLSEPTRVVTRPTPSSTRIPSPVESAAPFEISETDVPDQDAGENIESTEETEDAAVVDRCGLLLPVTAKPVTPEISFLPNVPIDEGRVPPEAMPALRRLLEFPGTVGLSAYEVGREEEGIYLNANVPMPLASVVKILNLVAYAQESERGSIDPSQWVEIDELNSYYLPGVDLGAHSRGLELLDERTLISGDPPATPIEEIPWLMIRFSSNAAADYLHLSVGQQLLEESIMELGLDSQTAPCPWVGQFLILANHERVGSNRTAVESYVKDPDRFAEDTMALALRFAEDEEYRNEEIAWRRRQPSFDIWQVYAENLNAKGSAEDYAKLMAKILTNQVGSPYVNIIIRRAMEWPTELPENETLFSTIGFKGGSLPGILTTAYYGQRLVDGRQVVVVLFFKDLPRNTYQSWRNNLAHDELARWLLSNSEAIPYLKTIIGQ